MAGDGRSVSMSRTGDTSSVSASNGKFALTASRVRIRVIGAAESIGFQATSGVMGRVNAASSNKLA